MTSTETDDVSWRIQGAVYGLGLFNTSIFQIGSVIIPLQVATMSPSPVMFGLVFSAAHLLPLFLSIHAGAMMDRLGARRVMLACTVVGAIMPLFYPVAYWIWAVVALQLVMGLAESMGWLGAQTMIGQYMYGRTVYAGRLSFIIRIGQLVAAPMAGVAWDVGGPWGAFILMSGWAFGAVLCALLLPPQNADAADPAAAAPAPGRREKLRALLPSAADYITAFRLLGVPAVVVIVALGALMHVGNAVQGSFYVAWLNDMGLTGTAIGLLSPAAAIAAALFSLATSWLTRYVGGLWVALVSLWIGVVLISVTPLLGTYSAAPDRDVPALRRERAGAAAGHHAGAARRRPRKPGQGDRAARHGQPHCVNSLAARDGRDRRGGGLEAAFYLVGIAVSIVMAAIAIYLWRRPEVAKAGEE